MIDINKLHNYIEKDLVIISDHARMRLEQRNISMKRLFRALKNGEIIDENDTDEPYPSCLILYIDDKEPLHIVISETKEYFKIVTAYIPDKYVWYDGYKKRIVR